MKKNQHYWRWMIFTLAAFFLLPNYYSFQDWHFLAFPPRADWGLSWIPFSWDSIFGISYWISYWRDIVSLLSGLESGWGPVSIAYVFLIYGLETIISLLLVGVMLLYRKQVRIRSLGCLVLSSILSGIYIIGVYLSFVTPNPGGLMSIPTHTVTIMVFTVLAYLTWSNNQPKTRDPHGSRLALALWNHRTKLLILAALLILVAIGGSTYQYYQQRGARDALSVLRREGVLNTLANYEMFVSVDIDNLSKPGGSWVFRNVNLTYELGSVVNYNDSMLINSPATNEYRAVTCPTDEPYVLLVATSNIPDNWLITTSGSPYWDYFHPCPSRHILHLYTPSGEPVHWHLYLFLVAFPTPIQLTQS